MGERPELFAHERRYDEGRLGAYAGSDCFVVGYPGNNLADPYPAIWRRASFATDPAIPVDNRPMFLVDGLTNPGMSGSPVYQRVFGPAPLRRENDRDVEVNLQAVVSTRLVGVYSGRLGNNHPLGQVGYAWYANRIDVIIDAYLDG